MSCHRDLDAAGDLRHPVRARVPRRRRDRAQPHLARQGPGDRRLSGHQVGPRLAAPRDPSGAVHQPVARHGHGAADGSGLPHHAAGRRAVRRQGCRRRFRAQRHRLLRAHRGGAQDVGGAVGRAGRPVHRSSGRLAGVVPAAAPREPGADRAHQRARAGQGSQGGAVRQRAGVARHRRGRRRRRGDRARGARADREHHRVRRHGRPRGDGAAPDMLIVDERRHRHGGARPGDRQRGQPAAGAGRRRRRHRRPRLHQGPDPRRA